MKVLFLALEPPYPPNDGGRIRTYNILKQIGQRHAVTLLTYGDRSNHHDSLEALAPYCREINIIPLPVPVKRNWPAKLLDQSRKYPISLSRYRSAEFEGRIRQLVSEHNFDVVHIDQIYLGQYRDNFERLPVVLTFHNVETLIQRRELFGNKLWLKPKWWSAWLEYSRWLRYEAEVSRRCDALVAVSQLEAEYFKSKAPETPVVVVSNGVDAEHFKVQKRNPQPASLLYTGRMDYPPNVRAAIWFCTEILPLIHRQHPGATLTIAGRDPAPEVAALANIEGVRVTGSVLDMRPYYEEASIFVVPLQDGGGTRLKILEAMSMEMPVVSTSIGSEGLEISPGEDILIANTPKEFSSHICRLIDDSPFREIMGCKARDNVIKKYDWITIVRQQELAYQAAISHHGRKTRQ